MLTVLLAAAGDVTPFTERVGVPLLVALIALTATLGAAAVSFALGRFADTKARRRDGYATATRELMAWAEYPYRIKRRTSDDAAALTSLAGVGHAHQEALRFRETWIRSEDRWVAKVFTEVRQDLSALLGPDCSDAWASPPVTDAAGMTIGGWGAQGVDEHLRRFERAVAFRFGWRRLPAVIGWHPKA